MVQDIERGLQPQAPWLAEPSLPRRMLRWLITAEKLASTLLLVTIVGLVCAQVGARYLFNRPLFWSDELARYCYVWLSFVAAVTVTAGRTDVTIDLIDRFLGLRGQKVVKVVAGLIVIFTCALLVYGSFQWLMKTALLKSPALGMPMFWLYVVVWGCFIMMALHTLVNLLLLLVGREEPMDDAAVE